MGRFSPFQGLSPIPRSGRQVDRFRQSNAKLVLKEDSSNYCVFTLKKAASRSIGNKYKALLYNRNPGAGLFWFKLWDETDSVVGTTIQATTMANMSAAIVANATTGSVVTMKIIGTIANATAFASNANLADATSFRGGV